jgi:hypothetical protein
MICHYCNNQTQLPEDDYHNHCHDCNVSYFNTTWDNNSEIVTNIITEINSKDYIFQLRPFHPTAPARIICYDGNDHSVINLPTIPNVTPKNVSEKLHLYLLFS